LGWRPTTLLVTIPRRCKARGAACRCGSVACAAAQRGEYQPVPQVIDPRTLNAVFLRETPGADGIDAVSAAVDRAREKGNRDDARVIGGTLYLWTPEGFGADGFGQLS